jgi:hypothetical protein
MHHGHFLMASKLCKLKGENYKNKSTERSFPSRLAFFQLRQCTQKRIIERWHFWDRFMWVAILKQEMCI